MPAMTAIELLRRLANSWIGSKGMHDDPCCFYCRENATFDDDERWQCNHKPDCPWLAAKRFVEEYDRNLMVIVTIRDITGYAEHTQTNA